MNRDELILVVKEENSGFDKYKSIIIVDRKNLCQGESIHFKNGFCWYRAFCKDEYFIGKVVDYNESGEIDSIRFYSFINEGKNISEQEYKKELAMIRLGLIECPIFPYI